MSVMSDMCHVYSDSEVCVIHNVRCGVHSEVCDVYSEVSDLVRI